MRFAAASGEPSCSGESTTNQFTYPRLAGCSQDLGFSRIFDQVDVLDPDNLTHPMPANGRS
jgi:hypothetical protein